MDDTGERGGGSGGDGSQNGRRKSNYQRHTAQQIQRLEGAFNECPHPDEKMRMQLSRELGLSPRQIKFWFQNRRTQLKAQHEKADNYVLRTENDKIRCENLAIIEALKNAVCPSCGGPEQFDGDIYFKEEKLREENAHLREELKRLESIAGKYMGRPLSQLHLGQPLHLSSLDLSMASFGNNGMTGPSSLNPGLLSGNSSTSEILPFRRISLTDMDKSLMVDVSRNAMEELIKLLQSNSPVWIRAVDGREVLNPEVYESIFPKVAKSPNVRIESSKDSSVVIIGSCLELVDMLMDANKWMEFFPNIVSRATTVEVISTGVMGSRNGLLQMMYEELQVLSPFVPTREFYFLRFCQQIEENAWAIVDVSYDFPQESYSNSQCPVRRLPSGCFIQDLLDGRSKITWMEHVEIEDVRPIHSLYRKHICSGLAFGAVRKLATLQRTCERLTCLMDASNTFSDLGGVITSPHGKRSLMKLSQRMVNSFCSSINTVNGQQVMVSGMNDLEVRATLQKCTDPGHPNSMVLSAATTILVPFAPQKVFDFFRNERSRPQWDVLSNHNPVQEVGHIACGSHPGNCISVLRAFNTSQSNMLILQESCIDSSGALVVYCPIDLPAINIAMSSEDPSFIPILSSGFAISPDAGENPGAGEISAGSLVTIVVQIIVSNLTSGKMSQESVNTINNLVGNTIKQIKAALNCSTC
ncbi:Homeobox-leucine zipper protein HDG11 [Heracleum sosnowskyi]|uniref:Homeobox-leucine zipper protein HDG11 n=1 Tax=Heracleum sosnowskyi TaxID=360622 RepID=A0AAD8MDT2_9APIA|nr:Homeobox-leucine zipper protein HDG11 [Heracleum sosnowskyi]